MFKKYYFDTSIWLDLFEERDELNFPKADHAKKLIKKIIQENSIILFSDLNEEELIATGYGFNEIPIYLGSLKKIIWPIDAAQKEIRKAKDLAERREIPQHDALHALIARNQHAILVASDRHFQHVKDIIISKRPQELI